MGIVTQSVHCCSHYCCCCCCCYRLNNDDNLFLGVNLSMIDGHWPWTSLLGRRWRRSNSLCPTKKVLGLVSEMVLSVISSLLLLLSSFLFRWEWGFFGFFCCCCCGSRGGYLWCKDFHHRVEFQQSNSTTENTIVFMCFQFDDWLDFLLCGNEVDGCGPSIDVLLHPRPEFILADFVTGQRGRFIIRSKLFHEQEHSGHVHHLSESILESLTFDDIKERVRRVFFYCRRTTTKPRIVPREGTLVVVLRGVRTAKLGGIIEFQKRDKGTFQFVWVLRFKVLVDVFCHVLEIHFLEEVIPSPGLFEVYQKRCIFVLCGWRWWWWWWWWWRSWRGFVVLFGDGWFACWCREDHFVFSAHCV